ncbi:hypothetical protein [Micromonospora parathelypteridis]|uniref:Uncharacterized protein n=1 Tax=Micromonospora parathelypteridis TaxID=1839617 RepID=A0A840VNN4_9ACTN|nr:hypothetical protein [Micromonospora parathelypteridis]MBB5478713.1 hypothetical protein [Micromonospora parathelypteridis]GGO04899.1 hypothetical protein GCM10011576_06930 [Micromonospora parathelypteridis]
MNVVIGSSVLLGLSGLARLAQVAAEAVQENTYLRAHEEVGTSSGFGALPMLFLLGVGLVVALTALAILVLALANLAGRNWTRIATWVIGGLTVAVSGGWLVLAFLLPGEGDVSAGTEAARVNEIAGQLMPAWVEPVSAVSGIMASPALLVALILLALPPAHAFYRWRRGEWDPSYPDETTRPHGVHLRINQQV